MAPAMKASRSTRFSSSRRAICLYFSGSRKRNARSSISHLICQIPSRLARGAYRSRVSRAKAMEHGALLSACQRRLRSRDASRISTMRRSAAMASSILRCISFCEPVSASASLACRATTPSRSKACVPCTSRATSAPKAAATGSLRKDGAGAIRSVGKAASKAAARVAASVCRAARIRTTPAPCPTRGSPVSACCPSKRGSAQATA
ncbi:hypothetical protein D9M68_603090 [compost metagenome]